MSADHAKEQEEEEEEEEDAGEARHGIEERAHQHAHPRHAGYCAQRAQHADGAEGLDGAEVVSALLAAEQPAEDERNDAGDDDNKVEDVPSGSQVRQPVEEALCPA